MWKKIIPLLLIAVPTQAEDLFVRLRLEAGPARKSASFRTTLGKNFNLVTTSSQTYKETLIANVHPLRMPTPETVELNYQVEWAHVDGRTTLFILQAQDLSLIRLGEERLVTDVDGRALMWWCVSRNINNSRCDKKPARTPIGGGSLRHTSLVRRGKRTWMIERRTMNKVRSNVVFIENERQGLNFNLQPTEQEGGDILVDYKIKIMPPKGLPTPPPLEQNGQVTAKPVKDTLLGKQEGFELRMRIAPD
jgi:hypothetical protein